jgi:endogenous inhibitor of DNA gyrase (YacG/DUF329 family)
MQAKCEACGKQHDGQYGSGRFCSAKCARGYSTKAKRNEINTRVAKTLRDKYGSDSMLVCPTCGRAKVGKSCIINNRTYCSRKCQSDDRREHVTRARSERAIAAGCGGHRKNAGRGKKGTYRGMYFQSSWEFYWIVYAMDHGVEFERNKRGFVYIDEEGTERKFYPDFYIPSRDLYLEVKGWRNANRMELKKQQFQGRMYVQYSVHKEREYVEATYGVDYIEDYLSDYFKKNPL